jgi:hypothetical protein
MKLIDNFKLWAAGRKPKEPVRDTDIFPRLKALGMMINKSNGLSKNNASNVRMFSRTPYVRCAINAIKQPLIQLAWEIAPEQGFKLSSELKKQIEIANNCFKHPNNQNSFRKLFNLVIEDYLTYGAAVIEQQIGADPVRPLWMWPVDAQSIQIYPGWTGKENEARYVQSLGFNNLGVVPGKQLRDDEIVYITANECNESPFGYGAVQIAYTTINRLLGVEEFAGNLASNAQPDNLLLLNNFSVDEVLSFQNWWRQECEGQGGTPAFGTTKTGAMQKNIEKIELREGKDESLYLKWQDLLIREIAAAFNLSPQNLNLERDVNRNTSETAEDRDWDRCINPIATTFAEAFTFEVLHKKLGFYQLNFKFVGLEREDELATAQIYKIEYENNAITPNMYRDRKGLPPMDNFWADMTNADMQIAMKAANEAKQVDDPNLKSNPAAQNNIDPTNSKLTTLTSDKDKQDLKTAK